MNPSDQDKDYQIEGIILEYLKHTSPTVWHIVMKMYTYKYRTNIITWLKDNPMTEKGTVLMLYWTMHPRFSKQFTPDEAQEQELKKFGESYRELIDDLEQKYLSGFYTEKNIDYDPYTDNLEEYEYSGVIPWEMLILVPGREIDLYSYNRDNNLQNGLTLEILKIISDISTSNANINKSSNGITFSKDKINTPGTTFYFKLFNKQQDTYSEEKESLQINKKTEEIDIEEVEAEEIINNPSDTTAFETNERNNWRPSRSYINRSSYNNTQKNNLKKLIPIGIIIIIIFCIFNMRSCI